MNKYNVNKNSKSFIQDILFIENFFKININELDEKKTFFKLHNSLSDDFKQEDGLSDSIRTCLYNFNSKIYRNILDDLTKPDFIREEEEFQNLIQYFLITN